MSQRARHRSQSQWLSTPEIETSVSGYVSDASTDGEGVACMEIVQVERLSFGTLYPCKLTPFHLFPHAVFASSGTRRTGAFLMSSVNYTVS
ncbi:MAG TPA: hypothetical protein VEL31_07870 [Ktedonobacteraceae bacterium]|nr:hypothetical protein [Ktedonobacteraceae bacterium]